MKQTRRPGPGDARRPRDGQDAARRESSAKVCRELGRDSLLSGDLHEALWHLRRAVEQDSDCSIAWQLLGRCFEELGEALRARRCYSLAFRLMLKSTPGAADAPSARLPIVWPPREPRDS